MMKRVAVHLVSVCICLICLGVGIHGIAAWWHYYSMKDRVTAHVISIEIEEAKNGTCRLMAKYFFEFHGKTYHGHSVLTPTCQNPWAAEREVESLEQAEWNAWVNPKSPSQSTLYNPVPMAALLSSGCCIGILVYGLLHYQFWRRSIG